MMRRVGFVGLGFMGRGMAANLAKGLPQLTVFDISKENVKLFENSLGREDLSKVNISQSVKSLAEQSDMICLSLPSESACREVIFGPDGIAQAWKSNRGLIVDHCTSSKDFATQISSELQKSHQNIQYLDCPVSGGPTGAKNATLSIMVGGTVENFDLCRPILDLIGKNVQHFGPVGVYHVQ